MTLNSLFFDLFQISIVYLVLLGAYWIIRNRLSFSARRFLIISLPILAVIVRLISKWNWSQERTVSIGFEQQLIPINIQENVSVSGADLVGKIYIAGVAVFLIILLIRLVNVRKAFKAAPSIKLNGIKVYESSMNESFSFFRRVHLQADIDDREKAVIVEHEKLHSIKGHSYDLLLMEIYHAIFWFNPALIFAKRELVNVHEFEVDQDMYRKHESEYLRSLLSSSIGSQYASQLLASKFFNRLSISKRIKTMKKMKTFNHRTLLIIPVIMIGLSLISWSPKKAIENSIDLSGLDGLSRLNALSDLNTERPSEELDKPAEFKGGYEALIKYMIENINYPKAATAEGTVIVSFTVNTSGEITGAKVVQSVDPILDDEALRVVNNMPDWQPGEKGGKKVNVEMKLPIKFTKG